MIVGISINFPTGMQYLSTKAFTYDGHDYIPIITDITPVKVAISDDHGFSVGHMKVTVSDHNGEYKGTIDTQDRAIANREAVLIKTDGTVIRNFLVESGYPAVDSNGAAIFVFDLSDRVLELEQNVIPLIDQNYYPDCPFDANYGEPIPRIYLNNYNMTGTAFIACYRVNKTDAYEYIASNKAIDQVIFATDCDGVPITPLPTITNFEGIYYLTTPRSVDCILANLILDAAITAGTPYATIKDVIETYLPNFVDGTFSDTSLSDLLEKQDFRQFYSITDKTTGKELIKAFCDSYSIDWYVDKDREIKFIPVDIADIGVAKTFQAAEVADFEIKSVDVYNFATSAIINYGYNNSEGSYNQSHQFINDTVDDFGLTTKEIAAPYLDNWMTTDGMRVGDANKAWKIWRALNRYPRIIAAATFSISAAESINPGDFIELSHENAISTGNRLYQVRGINTDMSSDTVKLTLWDYNYLQFLRTADKLLISATTQTVAGSNLILDNAVDGWYSIQNNGGNVVWSDTETLFSRPTLRFAGSDYYLPITRQSGGGGYPADMAGQTNFTFDFWIKYDAIGTFRGICFFSYGTSYWMLQKLGTSFSDVMKFQYVYEGSNQINAVSSVPVTTAWTHIALVKVGSVIGIYQDGIQSFYSSATITSFNATDGFFGVAYGGTPFTGYAGEIHMTHSNPFSAAPNAGKTDTITVPTAPYTDIIE